MKAPTLACVLLLVACGTLRSYEGKARAPEAVARVLPAVAIGREIRIEAVDGRPLGLFSDRAEVLPGERSLTVHAVLHVAGQKLRTRRILRFDAAPGQTYVVDADFVRHFGPRLWVAQAATGEPVALAVSRPPRPQVGAGPR